MVAFCLGGGIVTPSAHGACVTVWYYDSVDRLSGNTVAGYVENYLSGPCMLLWYPGLPAGCTRAPRNSKVPGRSCGAVRGA